MFSYSSWVRLSILSILVSIVGPMGACAMVAKGLRIPERKQMRICTVNRIVMFRRANL